MNQKLLSDLRIQLNLLDLALKSIDLSSQDFLTKKMLFDAIDAKEKIQNLIFGN